MRPAVIAGSIVAACLVAAPASAEDVLDPQVEFMAANTHYLAGEYDVAARMYANLLNVFEVDDAALYTNLGNSYFRLGAYGSAIFAYRRALRLEPAAELTRTLRSNLETTRTVLRERYRSGSDKTEFIYAEPGGLFYEITHVVDRGWLTGLFLAAWFLFFGVLVWRRVRRADAGALMGWLVPSGLAALLLGLLLWGQVWADNSFRLGVVIADGVSLREGRHRDARGVGIPEGMEVRITETDDEWTRVELSNGRDGWVETASVKQNLTRPRRERFSMAPTLEKHPVHLGLGATAVGEPEFTGEMAWYMGYGQRHASDGVEGRLVSMHTFEAPWDVWEMHPNGAEVVVCTDGAITLVQEVDGAQVRVDLRRGEYAINPPGTWHTADATGRATVLFITAGVGTEHRPR